jgi:hypothetical protein
LGDNALISSEGKIRQDTAVIVPGSAFLSRM